MADQLASPSDRLERGEALSLEGRELRAGGRFAEAVEAYRQALSQLEVVADGAEEIVARSLYGLAVALGQLGADDEAFAALDQLIERFGSSPVAELAEWGARALWWKAYRLDKLGRPNEADAVRGILLSKFGQSSDPKIQANVASGLDDQARRLVRTKSYQVAIDTADRLITSYSGSQDVRVRSCVASAHVYKVHAEARLGHLRASWRAADELFAFMGPVPEQEVTAAARSTLPKAWLFLRLTRLWHRF